MNKKIKFMNRILIFFLKKKADTKKIVIQYNFNKIFKGWSLAPNLKNVALLNCTYENMCGPANINGITTLSKSVAFLNCNRKTCFRAIIKSIPILTTTFWTCITSGPPKTTWKRSTAGKKSEKQKPRS
jgi:hypothetical protein